MSVTKTGLYAGTADAEIADTIRATLGSSRSVSDPQADAIGSTTVIDASTTGASRYEVIGTIGSGAMGRVLEARDKQFGRAVALKETLGEALSVDVAQRFIQEALITANLEHPGIPAVHERGVRDGRPFYVMRRVRGRTFAAALAEARTLNDRLRLLPVLTRVAHTVGFAHERGVVHRDLKPDNVLVAGHGECTVLDWGIAKVRGLADQASESEVPAALAGLGTGGSATVQGAILGTPAYMAPEQARGQVDRVDERTDVFALGALLYELLTGRAPYNGPSSMVVLAQASEAKPEPVESLARDAPAGLIAICARAMSAEAGDRYANAGHFAEALEQFQTGAVIGSESGVMKWAAAIASGLAGALIVVMLSNVLSTVSSIREQGMGALLYPVMAIAGLGVTVADWRTWGRYYLAPIALAMAILTLCIGFAGWFEGMSLVFHALSRPEVFSNAARFRGMAADGMYESLGNAAGATLMCSVQLLAWFVTARAVSRRRDAAPRGE